MASADPQQLALTKWQQLVVVGLHLQEIESVKDAMKMTTNNGIVQVDANEPEKKVSPYKQRLMEKGLDQFIVEAPQELVDMMRVAAKDQGDISLAAWARFVIADALNGLDLKHTVDGVETEWKFDKSRLDESRARTRTANMTPEQKKELAEKRKEEQKEERELVKRLLQEHRAKLAALRGQA